MLAEGMQVRKQHKKLPSLSVSLLQGDSNSSAKLWANSEASDKRDLSRLAKRPKPGPDLTHGLSR